jgi:hypothetical protein
MYLLNNTNRYFKIILFSFCFIISNLSYGQTKTEGELLQKIVQSLQKTDSFLYASVFPPSDTMAAITLRKAPSTSIQFQRSRLLIQSPELLIAQDSAIIKQASEWFRNLIIKGKKIGIHWEAIMLSRYELEALAKTRDQVLESIAPERFVGYVFLEDMLTRKIYSFTLSDIMKIGGKFYGGELNLIYEASSKDEFNAKLKAEKIRIMKGIPDSTEQLIDSNIKEDDEDDDKKRKQVVARKLYAGMLDGETPVSLYIRYIQGDCPEGICSWEAIFKFGDNDYSKQVVSKTQEGKWLFVEDETGGVMELELKGNTFIGTFSATIDKVDYDAELKEKTMTNKKMESLDAIIEKDLRR